MNTLLNLSTTTLTMSTRDIAELTGKEHKNVMADTRAMLEQLGLTSAEFSANLPDAYGRPQPVFNLPKRETLILVSGYSLPLRTKIINRWQELETKAQAPALPDFTDPAAARTMLDERGTAGPSFGGSYHDNTEIVSAEFSAHIDIPGPNGSIRDVRHMLDELGYGGGLSFQGSY